MLCSAAWPNSGTMRNLECYRQEPLVLHTFGKGSGFSESTWTTPAASDATRGGTITPNMSGRSLVQQVNTPSTWPTPRANDGSKGGNFAYDIRNGLQNAVQYLPTPTAQDSKNRNNPSQKSGLLNPDWVSWLMCWPISWSDVDALRETVVRDVAFWKTRQSEWYDAEIGERTTTKKVHRVSRLTALGNGQVPLCAATAFRMLYERMGENQ